MLPPDGGRMIAPLLKLFVVNCAHVPGCMEVARSDNAEPKTGWVHGRIEKITSKGKMTRDKESVAFLTSNNLPVFMILDIFIVCLIAYLSGNDRSLPK